MNSDTAQAKLNSLLANKQTVSWQEALPQRKEVDVTYSNSCHYLPTMVPLSGLSFVAVRARDARRHVLRRSRGIQGLRLGPYISLASFCIYFLDSLSGVVSAVYTLR